MTHGPSYEARVLGKSCYVIYPLEIFVFEALFENLE